MQVLPIEVPDTAYQIWERLSPDEKQQLETRLNRAVRSFLFEKNSALIQQFVAGKGPFTSEEELFDNVS